MVSFLFVYASSYPLGCVTTFREIPTEFLMNYDGVCRPFPVKAIGSANKQHWLYIRTKEMSGKYRKGGCRRGELYNNYWFARSTWYLGVTCPYWIKQFKNLHHKFNRNYSSIKTLKYINYLHIAESHKNKPAAQAAGADPSRCHSNNRQNPPVQ